MTAATPPTAGDHVYRRELDTGRRSSLSVIAHWVTPGARVLDVGTGTGALGRHLSGQLGCTVDGITHSEQERQLAATGYARLQVQDLESPGWADGWDAGAYDFIVCADVLEHVRWPEQVLAACARLLKPRGLLLVSVPNAGYAGFITELMHGQLRYGEEGLLDRGHLRFFTRGSFTELLAAHGWTLHATDTVEQPWYETEFHRPFDSLPPAVARYLLAQPDASAYQLLFAAGRQGAGVAAPPPYPDGPRHFVASYIAVLFFGDPAGFHAERYATAMVHVGKHGQTLRFALPPGGAVTRLRFDPADRPGFLRLRAMTLRDAHQQPVWAWQPDAQGLAALAASPRHQLEPGQPIEGGGLPLLMTGDDPQLELPVGADVLRQAASLEVVCDWPLSADYQAAIRDREPAAGPMFAPAPAAAAPGAGAVPADGAMTPGAARPAAWWQRLLGLPTPTGTAVAAPAPPRDTTVEVIVPVYGNLPMVRRCLASLLASRCTTGWHLTVIDDASADEDVASWLTALATTHPAITAVRQARNQGFVRTVNLGMRMAGRRDVVLLNSDAEVAGDWLDRLRRAAWSGARVASVTPFSNNATICSWPRFCEDNPLPPGHDTESLHEAFAAVNAGASVQIPTAVGFCMYIRRDALDEVGAFDEASFGAGYGEENDWCMRATQRGWQHLHALDVFVRHEGGASFSERRHALQQSARAALLALHPRYDQVVRDYVQLDPSRPHREAVSRRLQIDHAFLSPSA